MNVKLSLDIHNTQFDSNCVIQLSQAVNYYKTTEDLHLTQSTHLLQWSIVWQRNMTLRVYT